MYVGESYIKNMPLGNIMLSAAIAFSGSLPTLALKHFKNMNFVLPYPLELTFDIVEVSWNLPSL